jgi:fumarylacetoacetase
MYHALNVGTMLRPDMPLAVNYKHLPVAYHGRASSVRLSGTALRRPNGQRKPGRDPEPSFGPSRNLDFELELGVWVGRGNALGEPIAIGEADDHVAGFCLLNDWSARDIQGWEATPLGPFLGKSFLTTISPFIVTPEALAPFRIAAFVREAGDPVPMDYLSDAADQAAGGLNITMEAHLLTPGLAAAGLGAHLLSRSNASAMYWTVAQLLTHQASNGCDLRPGDMLGSGTLSGPTPDSAGSLLELSRGGRAPIALESGETRRFLEDGDTLTLTGRAERDGFASIGFGPCSGTVAG